MYSIIKERRMRYEGGELKMKGERQKKLFFIIYLFGMDLNQKQIIPDLGKSSGFTIMCAAFLILGRYLKYYLVKK